MRTLSAAMLAMLLLAPATAMAELRHVQLNVLGMDWEICAHTVRVALMKLPGIESAEVSLDKASADIRLKEGNRVTLPQLRELLRRNGYPTRDAEIEARGRLVDANGKLLLDLLNGSTMAVQPASDGVALRAGPGTVSVSGVSRAAGKTAETLSVKSVRE